MAIGTLRTQADLERFIGEVLDRELGMVRVLTGAFFSGEGSPENEVTAGVGSVYRRLDGGASTTLYVKETGDGDTGWVAK